MSTPNIPNISPTITLSSDDVQNLLFSSIAMEELGLAHIINAEGEKLQFALGTLAGITGSTVPLSQVLAASVSTQSMLDVVSRHEMILDSKLRTAAAFPSLVGPTGTTGAPGGVFSVNGLDGEVVLTSADGIVPVTESIPSNLSLNTFVQPGIYSSNAVEGIPQDSPVGPANPQIWTLYVSVSGTTVQQLYLSNPSIYYRVRQASGQWTLWENISQMGLTGPSGPDITGSRGTTGGAGPAGLTGPTGHPGTSGAGIQGMTGARGPTAESGARGSIGATGHSGAAGVTGTRGARGARIDGSKGPTGATGVKGETGIRGATGQAGSKGFSVPTGSTAVLGPKGLTGATGASPKGPAGARGVTGATGATGATGSPGSRGPRGATGQTGESSPGPTGHTGARGARGTTGAGATAAGGRGPAGPAHAGRTGPRGNAGPASAGRGPSGPTGATGIIDMDFFYAFVTGATLTNFAGGDFISDLSNGLTLGNPRSTIIPFQSGPSEITLIPNAKYQMDFTVNAIPANTTPPLFAELYFTYAGSTVQQSTPYSRVSEVHGDQNLWHNSFILDATLFPTDALSFVLNTNFGVGTTILGASVRVVTLHVQ